MAWPFDELRISSSYFIVKLPFGDYTGIWSSLPTLGVLMTISLHYYMTLLAKIIFMLTFLLVLVYLIMYT